MMKGPPPKILAWLARSFLLLLVVASPWPFGSVAPRAASTLAAALLVLYGAYWAFRFLRQRSVTLPHGWIWLGFGLAFVSMQSVPLPSTLTAVAPGVNRTYAPIAAELGASPGWHPISVEPFRTEWSLLQLLSLACAFHLANRLFRATTERNALAGSLAGVGVALSLFAVYQKARFGSVLYGLVPVESGTPFGPFVNHNHFAGYAEATALVALGSGDRLLATIDRPRPPLRRSLRAHQHRASSLALSRRDPRARRGPRDSRLALLPGRRKGPLDSPRGSRPRDRNISRCLRTS